MLQLLTRTLGQCVTVLRAQPIAMQDSGRRPDTRSYNEQPSVVCELAARVLLVDESVADIVSKTIYCSGDVVSLAQRFIVSLS